MIFYHGTIVKAARQIQKRGFVTDKTFNWKVKSKSGFVYLSLAYAPFYAVNAKADFTNERALVKADIDPANLYPEDDFLMDYLGHPTYTQEQLDSISLEEYKHLYSSSIAYMGNVAAKPSDIKVLGIRIFDASKLLLICDPAIGQINYKLMGTYYENLTERLYMGISVEEIIKETITERNE